MKITLEPAQLSENEVVIKGDIYCDEVQSILQFLKNKKQLEVASNPSIQLNITSTFNARPFWSNFLHSTKGSNKLLLYKEDEQYVVNVEEIVYLETFNNKLNIYTENDVYEAKMKLYEMKEKLSAYSFAQINKSVVVNIDFVKSVQAEFSGNYTIRLKNEKTILTVSRKFFKEFKSKI